MDFKQIKSIFTLRITKANVVWVTASWIAFHILFLVGVYYKEIRKIDSASEGQFGVKLSSELGFFEVLNSANFHFFFEIFRTFILFWIPLLGAVWLFKFCIIEELHLGWKRVSLVLPVGLALYGMMLKVSSAGMIINATHYFVFGLFFVAIIRWVFKGFETK